MIYLAAIYLIFGLKVLFYVMLAVTGAKLVVELAKRMVGQ